jgi:hypothetical protein
MLRPSLQPRELLQNLPEQPVGFVLLDADVVGLTRVDCAAGVHLAGHLVDIVGDVAQQVGALRQLWDFQIYDVTVNGHFADITAHIMDTRQCHFLFNQIPFFVGNLEIDAFLLSVFYNKKCLLKEKVGAG